jgi:hypothetical protein
MRRERVRQKKMAAVSLRLKTEFLQKYWINFAVKAMK